MVRSSKVFGTQFTALRREEELEKEMERTAVKIPVLGQDEPPTDLSVGVGNRSFANGKNSSGGDVSSSSSESSTPRKFK